MRPSRQTMHHCCQLIPLQITPPFIVSSLSLTVALPLTRFSTPLRNPDASLSPLSFLSSSYKPPLPLLSCSSYFPSYSLSSFSFSFSIFISLSLFVSFSFYVLLPLVLFLESSLSLSLAFLFRFHFKPPTSSQFPSLERPSRNAEGPFRG